MKTSDIATIDVLRAYRDARASILFATELIAQRIGAPEKVVFSAVEREERRGFIEYGVSLRSGWLTPSGAERLTELEQRP